MNTYPPSEWLRQVNRFADFASFWHGQVESDSCLEIHSNAGVDLKPQREDQHLYLRRSMLPLHANGVLISRDRTYWSCDQLPAVQGGADYGSCGVPCEYCRRFGQDRVSGQIYPLLANDFLLTVYTCFHLLAMNALIYICPLLNPTAINIFAVRPGTKGFYLLRVSRKNVSKEHHVNLLLLWNRQTVHYVLMHKQLTDDQQFVCYHCPRSCRHQHVLDTQRFDASPTVGSTNGIPSLEQIIKRIDAASFATCKYYCLLYYFVNSCTNC